jgi:hypothetical protein
MLSGDGREAACLDDANEDFHGSKFVHVLPLLKISMMFEVVP